MFEINANEMPMFYMIGALFLGLIYLYIQLGAIPEQRNKRYLNQEEE